MSDLVWIRGKDLRLQDHLPSSFSKPDSAYLFVLDPFFFSPERAKKMPHRIQYLLDSLKGLCNEIEALGGSLWLVKGKSLEVVPALAHRLGVHRVISQAWHDPLGLKRDQRIRQALKVPFELTSGETLHSPGSLRTKGGKPYSVYTPFSRSFRRLTQVAEPLSKPTHLNKVPFPDDIGLELCEIPSLIELGIERNNNLLDAGEKNAEERLKIFLSGPGGNYDEGRDRMDLDGTSRLSADLKFGVISPRMVWTAIMKSDLPENQKFKYTNELIWREFNYSTLYDNPKVLKQPFKPAWRDFPWLNDNRGWEAWKTGNTGYPIVDAAARELLSTGHVHNRARMISASFLTKHLMVNYQKGEAHYLKWLTDGDWAQNNMGWQWAAGCGADAQPWFRIFNPMSQGRKFDPTGAYVRKWLPELAGIDNRFIHAPWEATPLSLSFAGVQLGKTYPFPIVEHKIARERFLSTARAYFST